MRAYVDAFVGSAERGLRDRQGLAIRALFFTTLMVAFDALWGAATTGSNGVLASYGHRGMLWYIFGAEVAVVVVPARQIEAIGDDIASGAYEAELLRPAHAWLLRVADRLGGAMVQAVALFLYGTALVWWLAGPPRNGWALALALPSALLAATCGLVALHAFATLAFWVRDVQAAWFVFQKLVFVLGGMLLPLSFLPSAMERLAWLLPFQAMAYSPGRLASGHIDAMLLPVQLAWTAVLALATHRAFVAGERRMVAGR